MNTLNQLDTMKRSALFILFCLGVLTLISCAQQGENTELNESANQALPNSAADFNGGAEADRLLRDGFPQAAGGSEFANRHPAPVSNSLLQRQYPNTVILNGPSASNQIALTFDDGPDPRYTEQILDILKEHQVQATFFLLGARAEAYPDIVKRIHNEGHAIGNHTYWHPQLADEELGRTDWEVRTTEQAIENIIDIKTTLFRAPYGALNEEIVELLAERNYTVVGWSTDSIDWRQLPAREIELNILSNSQPGDIILMHDAGNWDMDLSGTVQSLEEVISRLQDDGMEFVTVPELIG